MASFNIGDKVEHIELGWGIVGDIKKYGDFDETPLMFIPDANRDTARFLTIDGRSNISGRVVVSKSGWDYQEKSHLSH